MFRLSVHLGEGVQESCPFIAGAGAYLLVRYEEDEDIVNIFKVAQEINRIQAKVRIIGFMSFLYSDLTRSIRLG